MAATYKVIDILNLPVIDNPKDFHVFAADPKETLTYPLNGVRKHTVAMDSWYREETNEHHRKYAEFVSVLGNVTDEFYGEHSDFDQWFLGKVNRNEQFFLIYYPYCTYLAERSDKRRVTTVRLLLRGAKTDSVMTFRQQADMAWSLVSVKDITYP